MLASASARADRAPVAVVEAGGGAGLRVARDDILVPRASTGPALDVKGRFLGLYRGVLFDTGLHLGFGALFDRDGHPAAAVSHAFHVAGLPIVRGADGKGWSVAAGPVLRWSTDVLWLAKWDDAHGYWMGRRWLGASVRAWRSLSPSWRLDVTGDLSLVGFESRPPGYRANKQEGLTHVSYYFVDVNRSPELGALWTWQSMRVSFELHRSSSTLPLGLGLGVDMRFDHTDRPASAYLFETMFRLSRAWEVL